MNNFFTRYFRFALYSMILTWITCPSADAQLPQYDATLAPSDYQLLFTRDIFSDSTIPAVFSLGSTTWTDAQIRFKGTTTRFYPKKSYRFKFTSAHPFGTMRQINFNSMYTDKSFLREKLAWDLFADMNALAPRASHSQLTVNGQQGLYLFIEKVDKHFLQNRGRKVAPMYSANDAYNAADLSVQPDSLLKIYYDVEINNTVNYADLKQLIAALNAAQDESFVDTVNAYFDLQSLMTWFTGNILMMMGDSYNKNYLLYRDTSKLTQQWIAIPWDYDLSHGRTGDMSIPYPGSLLNDDFAYTFSPLDGATSVLKSRFMATPSLMDHLTHYVDTVLHTIFTEERLYPRIDSLAALVRTAAMLDPQKWGTMEDFDDHIEALKYYVTARRNYLLRTFVNGPSGEYNDVTLPVGQLDVPYNFVSYDGRQIATLWFSSMEGLDSMRIRVHPNSVPPHISVPADGKYVKRWVEVIPYPASAHFTAKIQWMYSDYSIASREVGSGVQNERLLRCYVNDAGSWMALPSAVNPFANIVTVDSVTQNECGSGKFFALLQPDSYTQKWFRHPSYFWQRWFDVKFVNRQTGFLAGEHGTILSTTDGGTSWTETYLGIALPIRSIAIRSENSIFAGGDFGSLFQTTNSGASWNQIPLGDTRRVREIRFSSADDGWIWGNKGLLARTTNGGSVWTFWNMDTTKNVAGVSEYPTAITAVYDDGTLASTTDQGSTWSSGSSGAQHQCTTIKKVEDEYWILGDSGLILRSSQPGEYLDVSIAAPVTLQGMYMKDSANIFVTGSNGSIYYTTDKGAEWFAQYAADWHDLNAVTFIDSVTGIAVGSGGTILLTSSSGTVTGAKEPAPAVPASFRLAQNYPNPFNPVTTIRYSLPMQSRVTLRIYDILGREITTLVDGIEPAGEKVAVWDVHTASSGVYFYRLTAGTFVDVKKMVVVK